MITGREALELVAREQGRGVCPWDKRMKSKGLGCRKAGCEFNWV